MRRFPHQPAQGGDEISQLKYQLAQADTVARPVGHVLGERPSVLDFGVNVGDGNNDDGPAFAAAILNEGWVDIPAVSRSGVRYDYHLDDTVTFPETDGFYLKGGVGFVGINGRPKITGTHTSGPMFRLISNRQSLKNVWLDADSTRQAASATSNNYGIHFAGKDIASGQSDRIQHGLLEDILINGQPADGLVVEAEIASSMFIGIEIDDCGGHGFVFSDGTFSGRTNTGSGKRPGIFTMMNCRASDCGGNGARFGHTDEGAFLPYRGIIINLETFRCATDAAVRDGLQNVRILGEDFQVIGAGFGGDDTRECVFIAGRDNELRGCRYINPPSTVVIRIGDTGTGGPDTIGTRIIGGLLSAPSPTPATFVHVEGSATKTDFDWQSEGNYTNATNLTDIKGNGSRFRVDDEEIQAGSLEVVRLKAEGFDTGGDTFVIDDDAAVKIEMSANCRGVFEIMGNSEDRGYAKIRFRCTGTLLCEVLDSQGATIGVSTSAAPLTGSTMPNAQLNIAVHTDNFIYIENRTAGGTGNPYAINFTVMHGSVVATAVASV